MSRLAPLLRSSDPDPPTLPQQHADRPRRGREEPHDSKPRGSPRKRKYKRHAPSEARERALAALRANPGASLTDIAKIAKLSRSTVVNAHKELAAEARRKPREACKPATPKTDRRTRAQAFLKDELARGPKKVTDVEEAAAKAHVAQTLEQARADLGIVTSRANAGGVMAV